MGVHDYTCFCHSDEGGYINTLTDTNMTGTFQYSIWKMSDGWAINVCPTCYDLL